MSARTRARLNARAVRSGFGATASSTVEHSCSQRGRAFGGLILLVGLVFAVPAVIPFISGPFWFIFKVFCIIYMFMWARFTFPRYRYDQIMRLGWKVFIPITLAWIVVIGGLVMIAMPPWFD